MSREPSEGSRGRRLRVHRPEPGPPGPPRTPAPQRRRRLPGLPGRPILVLGVAVVAVGSAAAVGGPSLGAGVSDLQASGVREATLELRNRHRQGVRKAMRAPRVLGVKRKTLESIAECESHGDPRAVSSDGTYRGKYQFDRGTWKSNGGSGDPAKAPELEQDLRAAALYRAAGSNPWPNCG